MFPVPWVPVAGHNRQARPSQAAPAPLQFCWSTEVQVWLKRSNLQLLERREEHSRAQQKKCKIAISSDSFLCERDLCTISTKGQKGKENAPRSAVARRPLHLSHGTETESCLEREHCSFKWILASVRSPLNRAAFQRWMTSPRKKEWKGLGKQNRRLRKKNCMGSTS